MQGFYVVLITAVAIVIKVVVVLIALVVGIGVLVIVTVYNNNSDSVSDSSSSRSTSTRIAGQKGLTNIAKAVTDIETEIKAGERLTLKHALDSWVNCTN